MLPKTKYNLGDIVFNVCATSRCPMMITQINFTLAGYYYTMEDGDGNSYSMFERQLIVDYVPDFD